MQGYKNTKQAAEYLGISTKLLNEISRPGRTEINYYKPTQKLKLFKVADLDKWLEQYKVKAA